MRLAELSKDIPKGLQRSTHTIDCVNVRAVILSHATTQTTHQQLTHSHGQ